MTAGIAAAAAIRSGPPAGELIVTDEPFAHVLPNLSPRHVARPRLTRLLDDARGQAIILHAPAGYGKTSLAVEWLRERDDVAWFTAQAESGDVGAAVLGVALAASRLVPGAADRVRQRLSVVEEPAQAARTLAEILAEDLVDWPSGGVLAIDDYQHLAESDAAESFVDWLLVLRPSVRVLVATRQRPSWASARRVLAGEILEIEKPVLAMTDDEVEAVLGDDNEPDFRAVLEKAEGWPAVIGLVGMSPKTRLGASPGIADDLFRYVAEEVLRSRTTPQRRLMLIASVPRSINAEILKRIAPPVDISILEELEREGLLTRTPEKSLRFHPLVREFLQDQLRQQDATEFKRIALDVLNRSQHDRRWEDAFDAALMLEDRESCAEIAGWAASDLIRAGRIETLDRWLESCGSALDESPGAMLARASLLYRAGRFGAAGELSMDAAAKASERGAARSAALNLAGRATFALGELAEALDLYALARAEAETDDDRLEAVSGAALVAGELEDPQAREFAEELDRDAPRDREEKLRALTRCAAIEDRMGSLERPVRLLRTIEPVRDGEIDPIVHSSAISVSVHLQCAEARFDEALQTAEAGYQLCETYRIPWARDSIELTGIRALLGLGRFREADASLERLAPRVATAEDPVIRMVINRSIVQLYLTDPSPNARVDDRLMALAGYVAPATQAEYDAFLALKAVAEQEYALAEQLASQAGRTSRAVEATCYSQLALALVSDLQQSAGSPSPALQAAALDCVRRHLIEAFIVVARMHQPLLDWGSSQPPLRAALKKAGLVILDQCTQYATGRQLDGLTAREHEVLGLIAAGKTNAEIASALVVSVSTAKTHVHHIFKKLGTRNRSEATAVYIDSTHDDEPSD